MELKHNMGLPSRTQAEAYFEDFHVPDNIKNHCFLVNTVAVFLAEKLKAKGQELDLDVVDILSLLHDLFKPIVIKNFGTQPEFNCYPTKTQIEFWKEMQKRYPSLHETELFHTIFKEEFPAFAQLMLHYGNHDVFTSQKSIEEQIVHYADWRVHLDTIVSLKERTDDLFVRYKNKIAAHNEKGRDLWKRRVADEFAVEKDIFKNLHIKPEDLKELLTP